MADQARNTSNQTAAFSCTRCAGHVREVCQNAAIAREMLCSPLCMSFVFQETGLLHLSTSKTTWLKLRQGLHHW